MSNLLKRVYTVNKDERVIDYNDLIKKKLEAIMESKHAAVDTDGLERNQCMIETNTGIFNCSLDIELNKLINNIKLLSCTG